MTYWRALVGRKRRGGRDTPGTEGGEKSLNRQRGTAVSQKQRSSHEKNTWQCYSTPSLPLVFFLLSSPRTAALPTAEKSGATTGRPKPSSSHSPLEDIPQEALVRGRVHMRRGFVRAVIRHFSARSALSERKRKRKKSRLVTPTGLVRVRLLLLA